MIIEVINNAIVEYSDGNRESFDAIEMSPRSTVFGKLVSKEFFSYRFIPKHNVKKIDGGKKISLTH